MLRRPWHFSLSPLLVSLLGSCSPDPEIVERPVVVHSPSACAIAQDQALSVFYGAGDFEQSPEKPPKGRAYLREIGLAMGDLPAATRSIVANVSQGNLEWRGIADVPREGTIDILAWPNLQPCHLTRDVEARTDMAFGVFGTHLIVAGGASQSRTPRSYVGDLRTGVITDLKNGLLRPRSHATVTAFATGAVVAGGDNNADPLDTAEVYAPELGDFDPQPITLSTARSHHGAVTLLNGETLLVGGRDRSALLRSMEVIDPTTRRARTAGISLLAIARVDPTVVRLADGEILVAGGSDTDGKRVPTLEWFAADGSAPSKRSVDLVTGKESAFVPLEGGGALTVIVPETPATDFESVWLISADGTLSPGTSVGDLDTVRLFQGAEGAPLLWTGRTWLRWEAWSNRFVPLDDPPAQGPKVTAIANGDPGLALWLDDSDGLKVTGLRFATKTPYDFVQKPLLVGGPAFFSPDRIVNASTMHFDAAQGLVLSPGASAFLTDVTFADVDVDVDVGPNASTASIVLRSLSGFELEIGGAACAFAQAATRTLGVHRRGSRVDVSVDGAPDRTCPTPLPDSTRVTLGLRGIRGQTTSAARNVRVTRR